MPSSRTRTPPEADAHKEAKQAPAGQASWSFLPEICSGTSTLSLILMAEFVALVLTLVQSEWLGAFWVGWGWISLYVQWITLTGAGLLCGLRRWAPPLPQPAALLLSYALLLATAIGIGWGVEALWPLPAEPLRGFLWRSTLAAAIIDLLVLRHLYVLGRWKSQVRAEAEVRLEALESRLRPHCLFNTLNSIVALVRVAPDAAEQALLDLSDLFRAVLKEPSSRSTLGQELDWARRYLALEQIRLGDRLEVAWKTQALPTDAEVPRLLLQPIVENAVYHGIEGMAGGGRIEITGQLSGGHMELVISNPRSGESRTSRGHGLGLDILKSRLSLAFPDTLDPVRVEFGDDGQFRVRLHLPYVPGRGRAAGS